MIFKNKFTALPQCDSEGFVDMQAPCPRSGHCERYASPLRGDMPCPWSTLDSDHLERIHQAWLDSAPKSREELARYYAESCAQATRRMITAAIDHGDKYGVGEDFWTKQGRHH